jgi:GT2 family glycosyltransferase
VLRADASRNLGDTAGAMADLLDALRIAPDDLAALRRLFMWGSADQRLSAAMSLISAETDVRLLRDAVKLLFASGRRRHANLSIFDQRVRGWVAWDVGEEIELTVASSDQLLTSILTPDPFHTLASKAVKATSFELARPLSASPQTVSLTIEDRCFFSRRIAPNLAATHVSPLPALAPRDDEALPTVIIPVYDDLHATRACLDSLLADPGSGRDFRVLIVDDASPDPTITEHLRSLVHLPLVEVIFNDVNLGFVGSINRALASRPDGDVLLLNADTLVPPGFVRRLQRAAQGAGDVGTVVPLSNNSGISDFPAPFHANPLGSYEDVVDLDRLAQRANYDLLIDIPNGTGFCLYITRACLSSVGHLAETFERGYLEDVDFCLRARERGFRNVCAPSVYVGHAGSRSFGEAKRALVLKNLAVLDHRFPTFRTESLSFVKADPLRAARNNIERQRPSLAAVVRDKEIGKVSLAEDLKIERKCAEPGNVLAVIPARPSTAEFILLRGLAVACSKKLPQFDIVVAGTTFDDGRLMSHPNVFVSGSIEAHELGRVLSTIGASRILILGLESSDAPHPAFALARATALPVAYQDGSCGNAPVRSGDLAISPHMPDAWMIERIGAWLEGG